MLNIPNISNTVFPETKRFMDRRSHATLYRFSPDDYRDTDRIWTGTRPEDGATLNVVDGPFEGGETNPGTYEPEVFAPGYVPEELEAIANRLMGGTGPPSSAPTGERSSSDAPIAKRPGPASSGEAGAFPSFGRRASRQSRGGYAPAAASIGVSTKTGICRSVFC